MDELEAYKEVEARTEADHCYSLGVGHHVYVMLGVGEGCRKGRGRREPELEADTVVCVA